MKVAFLLSHPLRGVFTGTDLAPCSSQVLPESIEKGTGVSSTFKVYRFSKRLLGVSRILFISILIKDCGFDGDNCSLCCMRRMNLLKDPQTSANASGC